MRISYAPKEPADPTPENLAIYERIKERRKPRPLIPLDLALLHNTTIADGFNTMMAGVRTESTLSQALMEIAVCYVAVLNGAVYEWTAHAPLALKAGAKRQALEAILKNDATNQSVLTEDERDVLEFTRQSTKEIKVTDELMEKLKSKLTDRQVMELTMTVAGYNMVSRFLVALDVTESNDKEMKMPE
jgi:alkylhydroperoxidase family enzyme